MGRIGAPVRTKSNDPHYSRVEQDDRDFPPLYYITVPTALVQEHCRGELQ